ncbi:hypothetical protein [Actinomadura sp. 3N407]|uniref:hypothetical protein n=1 Tax=Actinomadura sp. 3N407 TaxID=3457423 RepID=UPI003FCD0041
MGFVRTPVRRFAALAGVLAALTALAACTAGSGPDGEAGVGDVAVRPVTVAVREPVWSDGALFAPVEDNSRVARIDLGERPRTTLSPPLEIGHDIVVDRGVRDAVYVPQPSLGRVAMLGRRDLRLAGTFRAGPAPSSVDIDGGSRALLAMSKDGSAVTAVRLRGLRTLGTEPVRAGPDAEVDGPMRGRAIEYHVSGPWGIAGYKGEPGSVKLLDRIDVPVHRSTVDQIDVTRSYVAEEGTDRLLAVGERPGGAKGLEVLAQARLDAPVEYVGADDVRIYAATATRLVVFETEAFVGHEDARLEPVASVGFRAGLPDPLRTARLSGLAVGDERVHLTLSGHPYLLSIGNPEL